MINSIKISIGFFFGFVRKNRWNVLFRFPHKYSILCLYILICNYGMFTSQSQDVIHRKGNLHLLNFLKKSLTG